MNKEKDELNNENEEDFQNIAGDDLSKIAKEGENQGDSEGLKNKANLGKTILIVPTDD